MRIACFWGEARSLDRISFRHEHLFDGFSALGHEPVLVTARPWRGSFQGPAALVDDLTELELPESWRGLGCDLAVGLTWLRKSPLLEAIAAAGLPRVAIADSDGQLGYAAHPRAAWRHIGPRQSTARDRLRAVSFFVRRYLASRARRDAEDLESLASARASSRIAFGSAAAIRCWRRFLDQQGALDLAGRAFVAPFPVPELFCRGAIPPKEDRVVAIGRWSDPQKDAPLLAAALARFLEPARPTRVEIFGADGEREFGALAERFPKLALRGVQEPPVVREALLAARVLLFASRWETGPHAAGEALTSGATLVSPPMPNFEGMSDGGRYGTLAADRSPAALAFALAMELANWDRGVRDAPAIATFWRARLHPRAFCASLLESVSG